MSFRGVLAAIRRSGAAARLGLWAYALCFLLGPLLHTAHHRGDHQHRADGGIVWLAAGGQGDAHDRAHREGRPHAHGERARLSDDPHAGLAAASAEDEHLPDPHGEGSAAHFAALLIAASLFAFQPPSAPGEDLKVLPRAPGPSLDRSKGWPPARGPPSARALS